MPACTFLSNATRADLTSSAVQDVLKGAISDKIFPGCAAAVVPFASSQEDVLVLEGLRTEEALSPVAKQTVYDLASLTKIMCTGVLVAQAKVDGLLSFDDCPFPSWPGIQIQHLLAHNSGLPDWKPFYERVPPEKTGIREGKTLLVEEVLTTPPEAKIEEQTCYSDLGFIALGHHLETCYQAPLEKVYHDWLRENIPQCQAHFVPLAEQGFHPQLNDVAPTAKCEWRGRRMHGQVHDDNCFVMGGVSGHAGLFGRLQDVVAFGRWLFETLQTSSPLALVLKDMCQAPYERALAFDRPTEGGSTGESLSPNAIGHLGFTGTSLWLDLGDNTHPAALYVLLTNRIYYEDTLAEFKKIRRRFHQEATTYLTHSFREKIL